MEKLEQTNSNTEVNEIKNEAVETKKEITKVPETTQDDINKEIAKKEKNINDTVSRINDIRTELGLEASSEMPPSVQKIKEEIERLKGSIEYLDEIPIEKGKYYRVTGMSEILSIVKNKSLSSPEDSFYDRGMLTKISKNSDYSIEELEIMNAKDPLQIREIYNKYILNPNKEKGIVTIVPRTKSNHGDVGFVKEGFFYNPVDKDSSHFGAPVIVGSEDLSVFEKGHHGSHHGLINKEIESNEPVVLKEGLDAENFEYWLYEKDKGWHKNNFQDLVKLFNENKISGEMDSIYNNESSPNLEDYKENTSQDSNLITKPENKESDLEIFDYKLVEPLPEELPEEYISRSMGNIVNQNIENDPRLSKLSPILRSMENIDYYGKRSNSSMEEFFSSKENSGKIKEILLKQETNNDKKFFEGKNNIIFDSLNKKINQSNRELASGDEEKKIDYYAKTNQTREFFTYNNRKNDAYSYASMMFGLPENFIKTEEGKEYLHKELDDKTIFLFGGGDSIKDLLKSEEFKPKKVINFDPYLKEEAFDKNPNGIYESQMISASDKKIREMTENNEIPKADEVWATYSVPFYLDSSEAIKELIENMTSVLNEGGNARISPIAVQNIEKDDENFETRKQALLDSLKTLLDSPDYNVTVFNDTLKIHKIKKESNNT